LNIRIPPGVATGSRVRVAGKGGAGSSGGDAGDLFIRVRVRPHALLERRGDDLYMDLPVTVGEAIEGATITVPTADGSVRVRVPAASQTGRLLRVKGHGVPHLKGAGRGDLYLRVAVHVPDQRSEAVTAASQAIDAAYSRSPREGFRL
jgi:DnaJ-class molecular chaperone